jgi:excisionase family DNA binding protein
LEDKSMRLEVNEVRDVLTVAEVSKALAISEGLVRALIRQKRLRALRLGRIWRVPRNELERFLREG